MKKYLLLLIMLLPIKALAYDIKCPEGPFKYQDTFECLVEGAPDTNYDEFSGSIKLEKPSLLTCEVEQPTNSFEVVSGDNASAFKYKGVANSPEYVKIKCEVTTKATSSKMEQIQIPDLKYHVYDSNKDAMTEIVRSNSIQLSEYVEQPDSNVPVKPRDTSSPDVRLKEISDENLSFDFTGFTVEYDISVPFETNQLNLKVVPFNELATYEIIGSQTLEVGDNTIDIVVTSPDGTKQLYYTLNIKRLKMGEELYYPKKDSSLKSLSIEGFSINFEKIIMDYNIRLKYDQSSIKVNAEPTNSKAKVTVSNTEDLKNGDIVEVVIVSEDGSNKSTYMINIKKDAPPKDYRTTIYIGAFVLAITIVIFIIIRTNRINKKNPLLTKKKEEKVENNNPTTEQVPVQEAPQPVVTTTENVNTVDLNNAVEPIETTTPVVDENFNVATSNVNTLDLSNAALPQDLKPTQIPDGEVPTDTTNNQQ